MKIYHIVTARGAGKSRTVLIDMAVKRWSGYVTKHSFALGLTEGVFTWDDPQRIAESLKASAENSFRRKATPF